MAASYRKAVEWIAYNDEGGDIEIETVASYVTTLLIADIFGKEPEAVAKSIVNFRKKNL